MMLIVLVSHLLSTFPKFDVTVMVCFWRNESLSLRVALENDVPACGGIKEVLVS